MANSNSTKTYVINRRYQVSNVHAFNVVSFTLYGAVKRDLAPVTGGIDEGTASNQPPTKLKKKKKNILMESKEQILRTKFKIHF